MPALEIWYGRMIMMDGRDHRSRLQGKASSPDISYLDPVGRRVTEAELTGEADVGRNWADWMQTRSYAPFFQTLQANGVQSDQVHPCVQRGMMKRVIPLRVRNSCILRNQALHRIEDE